MLLQSFVWVLLLDVFYEFISAVNQGLPSFGSQRRAPGVYTTAVMQCNFPLELMKYFDSWVLDLILILVDLK